MNGGGSRLTRRAVLRGAAVAGAAALVDPEGALGLVDPSAAPARTAAPGTVFSSHVGALSPGRTIVIPAARSFSLVGVECSAPPHVGIELRTRVGAGRSWSPWVTASVQGHDSGPPAANAPRFGEPVWIGAATEVELRSPDGAVGVRVHFVATLPGSDADAGSQAHTAGALALPLAQPSLDAGPGQPPIIARAAWARGHAPPRHVPLYGTVKLAFVHHSETPNGYGPGQVPAILSSIFVYHRYVRNYFDIAYNFAVDAFGRIWEARAGGIDEAVIGAHAGGYNEVSTGVVVLGTFMSVLPSPAALDSLGRLLAWKLSLHGVPALGRVPVAVSADGSSYTPFGPGAHVSLPRIAGHRDGDQTSCPGDALYGRLPAIRPRVAQLAGAPLRLTIAAPVAPVSPGTSVTIGGRLTGLATGAPLAAAPLEVQQITGTGTETTIAALSTDADGGWTYTATPAQNTLLRALHRTAPAAVSDIVVLAVAPVLTLAVDSTAPLMVSGTVAPAGPSVTLELYRVTGSGHRRRVATKRLRAAGGNFHARLGQRAPGRYVLTAQTTASVRYAAGSAAPLTVTLP